MDGNWRKKIAWAIAALLVILVAAAGFFGFQMTRLIRPDWQGKPGEADLKSARDKLKLLSTAQQREARGFIRLNETELNALLLDRFFPPPKTNSPPARNAGSPPAPEAATNAPVLPKGLLRAGVTLSETNFALYYWEKTHLAGYEIPFVWKRVMAPQKNGDKWDFKVSEMQIGNVQIPPDLWDFISTRLSGTDAMFDETRDWINGWPWVEVGLVGTNKFGEAKLYTYVPTNAVSLKQ